METKVCSKCGEEKIKNKFREHSNICNSCRKKQINRFNHVCQYCWIHFRGHVGAKFCSSSCSGKWKSVKYIAQSCTGAKICPDCGETKILVYFNKSNHVSDGYDSICKACKAKRKKEYLSNPDNKKNQLLKQREYKYLKGGSKKIKEYYESENGKKVINSNRRKRYKNNIEYNLRCRTSARMNSALHGGAKAGKSWKMLVGYDVISLKERLQNTMPIGYTWNDYLSGNLHIDHIIPLSAFNIKSVRDIDFKKAWALDNLQLLPSSENQKKGAKLEAPFQPSLAFGSKL